MTQKLIKQQNSAHGNWKGLGDESYRVSVTEMRHLLWWSLMQTKCFFYWSTVSSVSATKACLVNTNSVPSVYVCVCLKHWNGETVPQYCSWPSRQPVYLAAPIYSADTYSSCHLENDCVILSRFAFRVVRCRLIKSNLSNMLCVLPTGGCSGGNILKIKNLLGKMIMAMGETRWSPLFFCCDLMNSETHTHSPCCSLKAA